MAAGQVRGSVFNSRLAYLRSRGGEGLVASVLGRLSPEERALLGGMILPIAWFPMALAERLDQAIAQELTPHSPGQALVDVGRASAESALNGGPQAVFVRKDDPHYLLSHAPQIYKMYYASGRRTYEKTSPRSAILRTFDAESVTPGDCLTIIGWHTRAIELSGGNAATVEERLCRTRGDGHCEYHCSWS